MNDMSPERPVPASTPMQFNRALTATLEAQEWNVVLQALNEAPMPMRVARPLFDKLVQQLNQIPT